LIARLALEPNNQDAAVRRSDYEIRDRLRRHLVDWVINLLPKMSGLDV